MQRAQQVLEYWLGPEAGRDAVDQVTSEKWFAKSADTDRYIAEQYGADVDAAGRGELDAWCTTPRGRLALVILLDQLTRNIHRDSGAMYRHDDKALALAKEGIARGEDRLLRAGERSFLYMPLMHSEALADQQLSCALFTQLAADAPHIDNRRWAVAHHDIIARFGRFPHRNALLGRTSTADEIEFLKQEGSSF
jgi:uncharacterized protein (DUF924 family)